jgi:acyl-CoA hydrolase|tara:strand:- start:1349 stop:1900 length:552 start_codon:yes stop_codon:yes gene_type:complete
MPTKKVSESQTTLTELMIPSYANFGGKVHGGLILSLMDKVAYVCATKHAENYCVTASVSGVNFLAPVDVGDLVSLRASVNYVGTSSLIVGIRVIAENFKEKTIKHTNSSYFTFVSIDDNGKPKKVTGLELTTDQEIRRFALGKLRKEQKIADSKEFEELKANMDLNSIHLSWINENCIVSTDR